MIFFSIHKKCFYVVKKKKTRTINTTGWDLFFLNLTIERNKMLKIQLKSQVKPIQSKINNAISFIQWVRIYFWKKNKFRKLKKIGRMRGMNYEHSFYEFGGKGEHK
jgi:hypothetical protein